MFLPQNQLFRLAHLHKFVLKIGPDMSQNVLKKTCGNV